MTKKTTSELNKCVTAIEKDVAKSVTNQFEKIKVNKKLNVIKVLDVKYLS